ncbi:MAG: cyclic nucleotide-binding domain-containing protein, partial [Deltaproteobacteria bacterium]|nr:cyclic nucleotide-binding domain-containing protein [Deltaproteobacteria bacterium]
MNTQNSAVPGPTAAPAQAYEFLRSVPPFDILGAEELLHLVSRIEIAFFPKGQRIVSRGEPAHQHLYVIQRGAARVSLVDESGKEILVDIRGEGDYFGAGSVLEDKPATFD